MGNAKPHHKIFQYLARILQFPFIITTGINLKIDFNKNNTFDFLEKMQSYMPQNKQGSCWFFKSVIFNLFHAAIHFTTQFNLTAPADNFQSGIWNAVVFAQYKITMTENHRTISLCWTKTHLPNSCTWQHQWQRPVPYTNHSTANLNEN